MWFSPLKGAHLTLGQLDKTLPVDISVAANKNIRRGSFVYIKAADDSSNPIAPQFALYTATQAGKPNAVPYVALMSVYDWQAGMAGNNDQAPETAGIDKLTKAHDDGATFLHVTSTPGAQAFKGPRITAISLLQPAEYQTSAFEVTDTNYYVGEPLTISDNGKLTHYAAGKNIVGYVTAVPFTRWINNLGDDADGARITGGNAKVIEFSTAWIPVASKASAEDTPTPVVPGKLNVGKPEVVAAAKTPAK